MGSTTSDLVVVAEGEFDYHATLFEWERSKIVKKREHPRICLLGGSASFYGSYPNAPQPEKNRTTVCRVGRRACLWVGCTPELCQQCLRDFKPAGDTNVTLALALRSSWFGESTATHVCWAAIRPPGGQKNE